MHTHEWLHAHIAVHTRTCLQEHLDIVSDAQNHGKKWNTNNEQ